MISRMNSIRTTRLIVLAAMVCSAASSLSQKAPPPGRSPVSVNVMDRTRTVANDWYKAPPYTATYPYVEQLLRFSVAQKLKHWDWMLEGSQNDVFDVPTTSVSAVAAQGQLGLGGTYWAANGNNTLPAAVSFRQGFLRLHGAGPDTTLRVGRFEFFDGQETVPKDATLAWLQTNRKAQRLIGNFGFSNGQRSFDGVDGHLGNANWDLTGMAGRATQGVFNMNANPELNVDVQYLAYSRYAAAHHVLVRAFGIDYHDGRTGLTKTDNRALAVRQTDHKNIRIGTYGADAIAAIPVGAGTIDLLFWGVLQNGNWGVQDQRSGAAAVEGGFRLTSVATKPWLRGGWFRSTGDTNATDTQHGTFFQLVPTPRVYARFPFFNLMNNTDEFVQVVDDPTKKIQMRADVHFVKLTSNQDLWYGGGGAYDNLVFGYTGRPANGHNGLATWADISMDYQVTPSFALNTYYAHSIGKSVVGAIYPAGKTANFGYLELVYKWGIKQRVPAKK
jgi:hypothetical protein